MNYAALVTAIKDYTQNPEASFVANIPHFVRHAEERINRSVMLPELRKNAVTTVTAGSKYLARPPDFISVFSFALINAAGVYTYLLAKDANFVREAYPNPATVGTPIYYGQFDGDHEGEHGNFILGPSTDAVYTAELHYYYDPPSIVDKGTSWYGNNAKSVLLYGSLIEAYTYMKGEQDLIALYSTRYSEALGQLAGLQLRSDHDEYRNGKL